MEHALVHSIRSLVRDDRDGRALVMHIGPARDGSLLEVGVVPGRVVDGDVVVHAMPARRSVLRSFGLER